MTKYRLTVFIQQVISGKSSTGIGMDADERHICRRKSILARRSIWSRDDSVSRSGGCRWRRAASALLTSCLWYNDDQLTNRPTGQLVPMLAAGRVRQPRDKSTPAIRGWSISESTMEAAAPEAPNSMKSI